MNEFTEPTTASPGPGPSSMQSPGPLTSPITRRRFLTGAAALSLAAVMAGKHGAVDEFLRDMGHDAATGLGVEKGAGTQVTPTTYTFSVARDADLLLLDFTFIDFELITSTTGIWELKPLSNKNIITVQFPPQAIGEAAYELPNSGPWPVDPPPVLSAISGPSMLCFTKANLKSVTFPTQTVADLLNWTNWELLVPAIATESLPLSTSAQKSYKATDPTAATSPVTYIEYPYGLYLSPAVAPTSTVTTTFNVRAQPLASTAGTSDIWSATLQQATTAGVAQIPQVAAVYARDYLAGSTSLTDGYTEIAY
jgi:hypothetical protein